jgi:hypothetical protein
MDLGVSTIARQRLNRKATAARSRQALKNRELSGSFLRRIRQAAGDGHQRREVPGLPL